MSRDGSAGREEISDLVQGTLLADAVDRARVGLYVYDEDGRYVAVNRRGAELLGCSREELMDMDVGSFTPGGLDRSVLLRTDRREGVRRLRRRDGSETAAAFVVVPTEVSSLRFHVAIVWELDPDDPRIDGVS